MSDEFKALLDEHERLYGDQWKYNPARQAILDYVARLEARQIAPDGPIRKENAPDDVRYEFGQWAGSVTRFNSGKILGELGTGYGDAIGIESIADCEAIIALATALRVEWVRIETGEG